MRLDHLLSKDILRNVLYGRTELTIDILYSVLNGLIWLFFMYIENRIETMRKMIFNRKSSVENREPKEFKKHALCQLGWHTHNFIAIK